MLEAMMLELMIWVKIFLIVLCAFGMGGSAGCVLIGKDSKERAIYVASLGIWFIAFLKVTLDFEVSLF